MTSRLDRARAALEAAQAATARPASRPPDGDPPGGAPGGGSPGASPRGRRGVPRVAPVGGDEPPDERLPPRGSAPPPDADPQVVARRIVLRQLAAAPRSRAQLADALAARGCADDVAATVLDRMSEVGLVDDAAFAEAVVRSQREHRGLAARGLRRELARKGVSREVADEALAGLDDDADRDRARGLVAARLPRLAGLPRDVQARRLGAFLARKGYGSGLAYAVVREALDAAPEHRRD